MKLRGSIRLPAALAALVPRRGDGAGRRPDPPPATALPSPPRAVQDLPVFRDAFAAACRVFEVSKGFPARERLRLTDQARRSSRSVCANLVAAWQKRRYPAAFVGKLSDASAEAAEAAFWLATAYRCGYLDAPTHGWLQRRYARIGTQLERMMADPGRWCAPHDRPPYPGTPERERRG
jgi:four helix bundle protein